MRNRLSFGIVALLVLSLVVSGCTLLQKKREKDDFSTKTEDFMLRMQWEKFVGASLHFQEDLREPFLARFEDWEDFRVTEIALSRMTTEFVDGTERKTTYYQLEYYLMTDLKVHKEKIKIVWELAQQIEDSDSYWRIVTPFPELIVERK